MARKSDQYPLRRIVETVDEVAGRHPRTAEPVIYSYDVLECGHRKRIGIWKANGRTFEAPNTNRRCEPCFKEGRS